MTWQDLTVIQYQQLFEVWTSEIDPVEKSYRTIEICYNMTSNQVDSLTDQEIRDISKGLSFLNDAPEWKPVKHVDIDGKRYRFIYDARHIRAARYIEVKAFNSVGFVPELHKIAASFAVPQTKSFFGKWKDDLYDAAKHEEYSNDLRLAPFAAIHGSALFFCEVLKSSITVLTDYLIETIPKEKRTEARQSLANSLKLMDGNITSPLWQNMSV